MQKSRVAVLLGIVALVILIPVGNRLLSGERAKPVDLVNPQLLTIRPSILASGSLTHENEVSLTSEVIGKVTEVYVEEGDQVTAGQLVLQIDDEAFVSQVEQMDASVRLQEIDIDRRKLNIDNLERRLARSQSLFERELLDEDRFEAISHEVELARVDLRSSQARLVQARAQLEQVQDQLNKTRVRAPIDGVVTSLDIEVGETAITSTTNIPGSGLMTIADPASVITEVFVDEADVAGILPGQAAEIVAVAYPDQPLTGEIEFIANTAKNEPGRRGLSFLVRIAITDSRGIPLRPGMSCRAALYTETPTPVLALPVQALIVEEDVATSAIRYFVYVNRAGSAAKVEVTVGLSDDEHQEITSGLSQEDAVVVGPARTLRLLREDDPVEARE